MFGSNITTTKFPLAKEGYKEAIELKLADGSTTTFQKKRKLRIGDSYIDCVELDVNSPNLLSISQLGYTAIFTDQKLLLIEPVTRLQDTIRKVVRELSPNWEEFTVEIQEEDGLYRLEVDQKGKGASSPSLCLLHTRSNGRTVTNLTVP